jgi:hypothetical protein
MMNVYIGLHVPYPLFLSDLKETIFFEKYSIIKFYENPVRKGRVVPGARTDERKEGQKDMTNLTVTFRNLSNAPTREAIGK